VPPQSVSAYAGANAAFRVTAASALPVTYQWLKNGANLNGPNSSMIVLPPVQDLDAGNYAVVVASVAGSVTSAPASLIVLASRPAGGVINLSGPALPAGLTNIVDIAAGYTHGLALRSNGAVVGWGDNSFGETQIPAALSNVVAVAAGNHISLALT